MKRGAPYRNHTICYLIAFLLSVPTTSVRLRRAKNFLTLIAIIAANAWGLPARAQTQTAPRAMVVAWDGAVSSFVSELVKQGKLPNLAKLIEGGTWADNAIPVLPSKTAPGFASLWTGALPRVTGVSGNRIPRTPQSEFTILESSIAYNDGNLRAEPLWASAERAGLKVVLSHASFGGEKSERSVRLEGYKGISGNDGIVTTRNAKPQPAGAWEHLPPSQEPPLEIIFNIAATRFFGLLIDDPGDPRQGYDTLLVTTSRDSRDLKARLKPGLANSGAASLWSATIDLETASGRDTGTYLRLFDLKPDGTSFLLYFTRPTYSVISPPAIAKELRTAAGVFVGNGASFLYQDGGFGPTIPNGGSGIAEARYLETVALVQRQLIEANRWALEHLPWNLFMAYTPYPDEAEHLWRGYLDSTLPGYRPDVADRLRPCLEEAYRRADEFLALFLAHRRDNTLVALVSDHGMEGLNKRVAVNRLLRQQGLLATDAQGRVDLNRTKALYPSVNNGYILINSTSRKNGIVKPAERGDVMRQIRLALAGVRDENRQVVIGVTDAEVDGKSLGIGGDSGGDVYIDLLPGYDYDASTSPGDVIVRQEPTGNHGFNPARPSMRTLMVFNGPGIVAGRHLNDARLIDFAPTLAKLMGIAPPKNATGKVLQESFAKPR